LRRHIAPWLKEPVREVDNCYQTGELRLARSPRSVRPTFRLRARLEPRMHLAESLRFYFAFTEREGAIYQFLTRQAGGEHVRRLIRCALKPLSGQLVCLASA
jgi:hypothetical protein